MDDAVKRLEEALTAVFLIQLGEEPVLDPDNADPIARIDACAEELEALL